MPEDNLVSHVLSRRQSGCTFWSCDEKPAVGSFQGWRSQDSYLLTEFIYSVRKKQTLEETHFCVIHLNKNTCTYSSSSARKG